MLVLWGGGNQTRFPFGGSSLEFLGNPLREENHAGERPSSGRRVTGRFAAINLHACDKLALIFKYLAGYHADPTAGRALGASRLHDSLAS